MTQHTVILSDPAALDLPIYEATVASYYLDIPVSTLTSWVRGRPYLTRQGRVHSPPILIRPDPESPLLSFTNLIEAHVLRALRTLRFSMAEIRSAVEKLRNDYGDPHPLAKSDLYTDHEDIFVKDFSQGLVKLTRPNQLVMQKIVHDHASRVIFTNKRAMGVYPFAVGVSEPDSLSPVRIHIREEYGEPTLAGTGIPVEAILSRFAAGEGIPSLADDFGTPTTSIEDLLRWERGRRLPTAA